MPILFLLRLLDPVFLVLGAGVLVLWHGYNYPIEKNAFTSNMPLKNFITWALACICVFPKAMLFVWAFCILFAHIANQWWIYYISASVTGFAGKPKSLSLPFASRGADHGTCVGKFWEPRRRQLRGGCARPRRCGEWFVKPLTPAHLIVPLFVTEAVSGRRADCVDAWTVSTFRRRTFKRRYRAPTRSRADVDAAVRRAGQKRRARFASGPRAVSCRRGARDQDEVARPRGIHRSLFLRVYEPWSLRLDPSARRQIFRRQ